MPERDEVEENSGGRSKFPLIPIFLHSLKIIFLQYPKLFLSIYVTTALPLSLLVTALSLSSRHLKRHIIHLQWLARVVPIWIEADNVIDESRIDLRLLLRHKALYGVLILVFSLLAVISTVNSTLLAYHRKKRPTITTAFATVKVTWTRPLVTCVVSYAVWVLWRYMVVPAAVTAAAGYTVTVAVTVVGAVVEVYLMAVLSLGMVVSVAEEWVGLDAVRVGSGLMRDRRLCGWALSGFIVLASSWIGKQMVEVMDGQDIEYDWTVEMRLGYMVGLVVLIGWVVLWSYVVVTIFYCECRKQHVIVIKEEQSDLETDNI